MGELAALELPVWWLSGNGGYDMGGGGRLPPLNLVTGPLLFLEYIMIDKNQK